MERTPLPQLWRAVHEWWWQCRIFCVGCPAAPSVVENLELCWNEEDSGLHQATDNCSHRLKYLKLKCLQVHMDENKNNSGFFYLFINMTFNFSSYENYLKEGVWFKRLNSFCPLDCDLSGSAWLRLVVLLQQAWPAAAAEPNPGCRSVPSLLHAEGARIRSMKHREDLLQVPVPAVTQHLVLSQDCCGSGTMMKTAYRLSRGAEADLSLKQVPVPVLLSHLLLVSPAASYHRCSWSIWFTCKHC